MQPDDVVLFREIADEFGKHPKLVDIQSDSMDVLQLFLSIKGEKGVFMGITEDGDRRAAYADAIGLAEEHGLLTGAGRVNIHHRYRALTLKDARVAMEIEKRSKTPTAVMWATRDRATHELLLSGDTSSMTDTELLGYGRSCRNG